MSDNLEPRQGDVWRHRLTGNVAFVVAGEDDELEVEYDDNSSGYIKADFTSTFELVLRDGKPVPQPQPPQDGETVTVECAVIVDGRDVYVRGETDESAANVAATWSGRHAATIPLTIKKSCLWREVPVLPTVNVTGH